MMKDKIATILVNNWKGLFHFLAGLITFLITILIAPFLLTSPLGVLFIVITNFVVCESVLKFTGAEKEINSEIQKAKKKSEK